LIVLELKGRETNMKKYCAYLVIVILLFSVGCQNTEVTNNKSISQVDSIKKNVERGVKDKTGADNKLYMGVVPSSNVSDMNSALQPLIKYLESKISRKIVVKFADNYEKIADKLNTEYDFAMMGAYSYLEAHSKSGVEPLVKSIRNGKPSYSALIIARADSGIKKIEDIKADKRVIFTDRYSTSGFLFPAAEMIKSGIDITKIKYKFVKGHDNIVKNVSVRSADVGACYEGAITRYLPADKVKELIVIKETEQIPGDPIVIGKRIIEDTELRVKMREAFLNLKDRAILNALAGGLEGYAPAADGDYNIIRDKIKLVDKYIK